jgi:CubicO group peptidase (beta-lactamase class C family)
MAQIEDNSLEVFLVRGCDDGVYPGAVAAVGSADGIDRVAAVGIRDPERDEPVTRSTLFDAASLTKPVVTATVALALVERGVVALSDELGRHVSNLDDRRDEIRLVELLTHSSGLQPYAFSESWESRADALTGLANRPLLPAKPGSRYEYSCLNFVYLAEVLRHATGCSLADLADTFVFTQADMDDSRLGPATDASSVAATYDHTYRDRILPGEIHDPLGWAMDGESGNAGLFTTVDDLAMFAQASLADGTGTEKLLSTATIDRLQDDWLPGLDTRHSLGWRLAGRISPAPNWSRCGLGHTGYTGTSLWLDHNHDRFAVLLTNQVYDGKETDLIRFRERFHAMTAAGQFD